MKKILTTLLSMFVFSCGSPNSPPPISGPSPFPMPSLMTSANAADANGYTTVYECKSGGSNCNVDISTYVAASCGQTITTSTTPTSDWTAINWSNSVICIQEGDHTGRGVLTIGSSGTSGSRKVLRCVTTGGAQCSNPVDVGSGNRAIVKFLDDGGNDYWIIDRLTISPGGGSGYFPVHFDNSSTNILNRFLVEGGGADSDIVSIEGGDNHTIQNGVVRSSGTSTSIDIVGIDMWDSTTTPTNIHLVNLEVYNIKGHAVQFGASGTEPAQAGGVLENSDLYVTTAMYTDGSGNFTVSGTYMAAASLLQLKVGGTSGNPIQIIHNRLSGSRSSDDNACCDFGGDVGPAINTNADSPTANSDYVLFQDNIIRDSQYGVISGSSGYDHVSFIGNIWDNIREIVSGDGSVVMNVWGMDQGEVYLNQVTRSTGNWIDRTGTNNDIRCNRIISSGAAVGSLGSGSTQDYNAYWDSTDGGESNVVDESLTTRDNSTAYTTADYLILGSPAADGSTDDDFFSVITNGTSAGSEPTYRGLLNAVTVDGTVETRTISSVLSQYDKLLTGATIFYIPYARWLKSSASPEYTLWASLNCGATSGRGINDDTVSAY